MKQELFQSPRICMISAGMPHASAQLAPPLLKEWPEYCVGGKPSCFKLAPNRLEKTRAVRGWNLFSPVCVTNAGPEKGAVFDRAKARSTAVTGHKG